MVRRVLSLLIAAGGLFAEHVYIGTSGKGIYVADFDSKTGKLGAPSIVSDAEAPSYLAIDGRYLYAVNEVKDGALSSFSIDSNRRSLANTIRTAI